MISHRQDCWRAGVTRILDRCLAVKNLSLRIERHALVLSNPTNTPIDRLQIRCHRPSLFLPTGQVLMPDPNAIFCIDHIPPFSSVPLFYSEREAEVGDAMGVGRWEYYRMALEEARHLIMQFAWRGRRRGKGRPRRWDDG